MQGKDWIIVGLGVVVLFLLLNGAGSMLGWAWMGGPRGMMGGMMGGAMGSWGGHGGAMFGPVGLLTGLLGMFLPVVALAAVILGGIWLIRRMR